MTVCLLVCLICQQTPLWTEDGQNGPSGPHVLPSVVGDSLILSGLAQALLLRKKGKTAVEEALRCDYVTLTDVKPLMPRK